MFSGVKIELAFIPTCVLQMKLHILLYLFKNVTFAKHLLPFYPVHPQDLRLKLEKS